MYDPIILSISFPALAPALSLRYPSCNPLLTLCSLRYRPRSGTVAPFCFAVTTFLWRSFTVVAGGRTGFCGLPSSSNTCLTINPPLARFMCVRSKCVLTRVQLSAVHHLRDPLQCLHLALLFCSFRIWLIPPLLSTLFLPFGKPRHLCGRTSACRSVSASLYCRANARVLFMCLVLCRPSRIRIASCIR